MDVEILPLQKIFALDVQFQVPLYQRPYVWDKDQQWLPLWEDVLSLAEQFLSPEGEAPPHFLGAVVVRQVPQPVGELTLREVIDGQQRLTTLQLLIDAVEEVVREGNDKSLEGKKLRKLILNDQELFQGDKQFKIWPTASDQDAFRQAMRDENRVTDALRDKPIVQAHSFFKSKAREWILDTEEGQSPEERVEALVKSIGHGVSLVVIGLKEDDNAQAIFETLNARGTPLLASDLVKNHMLNSAQAQGEDVEALHRRHWRPLEEDWWREELALGRIRWPRVDAFLFYWLSMTLGKEVSTQRLFDEYRKHADNSGKGPIDIANSISSYANVFQRLDSNSHEDAHILTFLYRWEVSQLRVMTPMLLWLFSNDVGITREELRLCLQLLESWFMRRMICGRTTNGYANFLHPLLHNVRSAPREATVATIQSALVQAEAKNTACPSNGELQTAVLGRPLYKLLSQKRLRMILEAVEDDLRVEEHMTESMCPKNLTIEHLLPAGWKEPQWPSPPHNNVTLERRVLVDTVGNLTLVNAKLNPAMSNSSWADKRPELEKHSSLHLNKILAISSLNPVNTTWHEDWNDDTIRERGEWMANRVCKIWKHPSEFEN